MIVLRLERPELKHLATFIISSLPGDQPFVEVDHGNARTDTFFGSLIGFVTGGYLLGTLQIFVVVIVLCAAALALADPMALVDRLLPKTASRLRNNDQLRRP